MCVRRRVRASALPLASRSALAGVTFVQEANGEVRLEAVEGGLLLKQRDSPQQAQQEQQRMLQEQQRLAVEQAFSPEAEMKLPADA